MDRTQGNRKFVLISVVGLLGVTGLTLSRVNPGQLGIAAPNWSQALFGRPAVAATGAPAQLGECRAECKSGWSSMGLVRRVTEAVESIQEKAEILAKADRENERLRLENTYLRFRLESAAFDSQVRGAAEFTASSRLKLAKETGSVVGRSLASIRYRPPTNLLPLQLYTLGVSYFKAREDEKAATILTILTNLEDNHRFQTPENFLLTGIAWYRLENFEQASAYFGRVLSAPKAEEILPYQAQARLWQGLVAHHLGQHATSQKWLLELVDHHPQSKEAAWVNSTRRLEVKREPAEE